MAQMFYNNSVEAITRLRMLSEQMSLEPAEEHPMVTPYLDQTEQCPNAVFIHPAMLPDGRRVKLLKTLLSSACERDCYYCPFRAGRDFRRVTFRPEEFARLFMRLVQKGIAEGVFLSSAIASGGIRTQDRLLETAEILRFRMGFGGYIHLKIMPGAERAQVERAMQLADRVSINLEAPNDARLSRLAPHKQFTEELLQPLEWMDEIRRSQPFPITGNKSWRGYGRRRWPSSATQFVVGGAEETDLELLLIAVHLYHRLHLSRAYYSSFRPIPDTPLEHLPPTSSLREHRLYQASFLLRDYGFEVEELPFEGEGMLPLHQDPKWAWAQKNLAEAPLEINRADRQQLLRVPGIGPKSADCILQIRRQGKIRSLSTLRKLGIPVERAAPFLLFDGRRADLQLPLF